MPRPLMDLEWLGEAFGPVFDTTMETIGRKDGQFRFWEDAYRAHIELYSLDLDATTRWTPPVVVRKASDESVTSSTTLQNDDDFTFSVPASDVWVVSIRARVSVDPTPDIKIHFTAPTSATFNGTSKLFSASAVLAHEGDLLTEWSHTPAAEGLILEIDGTFANSTTAGALTMQWAQNTSNGTATTLHAGSYMVARKVQ